MAKTTVLHEILAVEDSKRGVLTKVSTEAEKQFKDKADRYEGFVRTYEPVDAEGEKIPPEKKDIGDTVSDKLDFVMKSFTDYVDVSLTKEATNRIAGADLVVDGETLFENVPATGLLFLEKRLKVLRDLFQAIPTLDPAETWEWSNAQNCWVSEIRTNSKTKKVMKNHVKSEATDKHPAQVEVYHDDVTVGHWEKRRFSGALSVFQKSKLLERLDNLLNATVQARMRANMQPIENVKIGQKIWEWLSESLSK